MPPVDPVLPEPITPTVPMPPHAPPPDVPPPDVPTGPPSPCVTVPDGDLFTP